MYNDFSTLCESGYEALAKRDRNKHRFPPLGHEVAFGEARFNGLGRAASNTSRKVHFLFLFTRLPTASDAAYRQFEGYFYHFISIFSKKTVEKDCE